jgi:DHA1 family inner membrane transport protein
VKRASESSSRSFGLGANPVLSSLAVRYAGVAATLGVALSVSAYNLGTAVGSSIAGLALDSHLGSTGAAVVGTGIAALTLIPVLGIARIERRRHGAHPLAPAAGAAASCCQAA